VVVVDDAKHLQAFRGEAGTSVAYLDDDLAVVRRAQAR
jgi:hypothetical protein